MIALVASLALAADGVDAHGFVPAVSDGEVLDPLAVWRAEAAKPKYVSVTGLFEYANRPLVYVNPDGSERALLDDVVALNAGAHVGLHERVAVSLALPLVLASRGDDGMQGPTLGDARLAAPIALLYPEDGGLSASVVPFVDLPFGSKARYLGGGFGGGGLAAARFTAGAFEVDANAGAEAGPGVEVDNLRGGAFLLLGGAAGYALTETLGLRGELVWKGALNDNPVSNTESPGEVLVSLRGRQEGLSWTVGAASAITGGAGAATFRGFAGLGYTAGKPKDTDLDGLADKVDPCPTEAEIVNGWKDDDGCPDKLASVEIRVTDPNGNPVDTAKVRVGADFYESDIHGIVRLVDRIPETELPPGDVQLEGYEKTAFDGRAIPEAGTSFDVTLPWVKVPLTVHAWGVDRGAKKPLDATVRFEGSPRPPETFTLGPDGGETLALPAFGRYAMFVEAEGWLVERRSVETKPGDTLDLEVELRPAKAVIRGTEIQILEQVKFDSGKATIKPESFPLLEQIAQILADRPDIKLVEVQGHTDDKGSDASNQTLSQKRVESVVAWLVANGKIDPARLVPKGYGETKPMVPNTSDANRAQNRRVQFVILEQGAPK